MPPEACRDRAIVLAVTARGICIGGDGELCMLYEHHGSGTPLDGGGYVATIMAIAEPVASREPQAVGGALGLSSSSRDLRTGTKHVSIL